MKSILVKVVVGIALVLAMGTIFVSNMPLGFVVDKVRLPPGIQIESLHGSVWGGHSRLVWKDQIAAMVGLGRGFDLFWKWCPAAELVNACVHIKSAEIKSSGEIAYSILSRKLSFKEVSVFADLQDYQLRFKTQELLVDGQGQFDIDDFFIQPDFTFPKDIKGQGKISNLAIQGIEAGEYQFELLPGEQGAKIPFQGGTQAIEVNGTLELQLQNPQMPRYYYIANLTSKNNLILRTLSKYAQFTRKDTLTFSGGGNML